MLKAATLGPLRGGGVLKVPGFGDSWEGTSKDKSGESRAEENITADLVQGGGRGESRARENRLDGLCV